MADPDGRPRMSVEDAPPQGAPDAARSVGKGRGADGEGGAASSARRSLRSFVAWARSAAIGHENAVMGGICGFVMAILIFAIGFWRALFVLACVAIGVAIGQLFDGNPRVIKAFRRFFSDNR